jgi:hypothetical protein
MFFTKIVLYYNFGEGYRSHALRGNVVCDAERPYMSSHEDRGNYPLSIFKLIHKRRILS